MAICYNLLGISCSKRYVYNPGAILRLPEIIICRECKSKTSPAFVVDSYDLEIYMGTINIYTSKPFLACYDCKSKIRSYDEIQCERCIKETRCVKYCDTCGAIIKKFRRSVKYA
jgi:hypothetical protein